MNPFSYTGILFLVIVQKLIYTYTNNKTDNDPSIVIYASNWVRIIEKENKI